MNDEHIDALPFLSETAPTVDQLEHMFVLRKSFMHALSQSNSHSESISDWPLDLQSKFAQRHLRDVTLRGVEEVFEALNHLKNWKPHRKTEIREFDREKFLEEWVDAFNYFFSALILAGFDADDLYKMYLKKDHIIHQRIKDDY